MIKILKFIKESNWKRVECSMERYEKWDSKLISGNSGIYLDSKQTGINWSRVEQSKFPNIPTTSKLLRDKQV